jgi:hypothetical protein
MMAVCAPRRARDFGRGGRGSGGQFLADPMSPLDILMTIMQDRFEQGDLDGAVAIAKAVAPFVHPKPHGRVVTGTIDTLRDHQLVELCRGGVARAGAAQKATD